MPEEFAIEYKTFIGGNFDRLVTHRGSNGKPHTRETAQLDVDWFNRREEGIARLVMRQATEWVPADKCSDFYTSECPGILVPQWSGIKCDTCGATFCY